MKKKSKVKERIHLLYLTCEECGNKFKSKRYQKYCCVACRKIAAARFAKTRYAEMRDIVLKARGVIK